LKLPLCINYFQHNPAFFYDPWFSLHGSLYICFETRFIGTVWRKHLNTPLQHQFIRIKNTEIIYA